MLPSSTSSSVRQGRKRSAPSSTLLAPTSKKSRRESGISTANASTNPNANSSRSLCLSIAFRRLEKRPVKTMERMTKGKRLERTKNTRWVIASPNPRPRQSGNNLVRDAHGEDDYTWTDSSDEERPVTPRTEQRLSPLAGRGQPILREVSF